VVTRRALVRAVGLTTLGLLAACSPTTSPSGSQPATAAPAGTQASGGAAIAVGTDSGVLERVPPAVALDQGFFSQLGVKPDIEALTDGSKVLAGVVANQLGLGESGINNVLAAIEKSPTVKILGTTHLPVGYVVYANAHVGNLRDLEGKSIGTGAVGAFLYVLMFELLKKNGVDPGKVSFVNIGASPDVYRAVSSGKVDVGPSTVTFLSQAQKDGLKVLANIWQELPDFVSIGVYASDDSIAKNREAIVRTLAAYARTYRFILGNEQGKAAWIKGAQQFAQDEVSAAADWQWLKDNKGLQTDLAITNAQLDYMQQVNIDTGSQSRIVPFEQLADTSLVQDALKLAQ
jgi:ABC-type nitrate/sulfonate/bicarbonate transport system substrate-binding protein